MAGQIGARLKIPMPRSILIVDLLSAGIFAGDLIQAGNGRTVEDWDGLLDAIEALPLGNSVDFDVQREGRKLRVAMRLEAARD